MMADEYDYAEAAAIVGTAHLLLRGLIPAFIGCSIGSGSSGSSGSSGDGGRKTSREEEEEKEQVRACAFQMTYHKDLPKFGKDGKLYTHMCMDCIAPPLSTSHRPAAVH